MSHPSEETDPRFVFVLWGLAGAVIGDKIVENKEFCQKKGGDGLRSGRSVGASRSGVQEVQVPEVECKDADMNAGIAMPGVTVDDFVYYNLHCCDWWLHDHSTGKSVPLETLPHKENKYGVSTWIKNQEGRNVVYPSTNDLRQMPGLYTTQGINGDNFQLKYAVKTTLSGKDKELADKMKSKKPFYNYALIPVKMYLEVLPNLGNVLDNNKRDTFFYNCLRDTLKFFVGTTKDLREAKDWDYETSKFLGTVKLQVEESKSATIGVGGNIDVTTTLKQVEYKGSSAGLTEYESDVDRIPMFGSSVVVMPICLNKDKTVGTKSIPQEQICYLCGEYSAINLTRDEEVYAGCGHTSLCSNCVSTWNDKCFERGTCPTCRYAWNTIVIANNQRDWEAKKTELPADAPAELPADAPAELQADAPAELLADAPAELQADAPAELLADATDELMADATAELPADATAELKAAQQVYDPERAKEREEAYRMRKINKESTNMFVDNCWNILFQLRQHDGKDDDVGVELTPVKRKTTSLTYKADAGQLLKVKIQNKSKTNLVFRPVYRTTEGDEEPEDLVDLKYNEVYELPWPLQKDAGEKSDAWLLKDSQGTTVLTLNFTVGN